MITVLDDTTIPETGWSDGMLFTPQIKNAGGVFLPRFRIALELEESSSGYSLVLPNI